MRGIIQRVNRANIKVNDKVVGEIEKGILLLLGIGKNDNMKDIEYIANKVANLRIFQNNDDKFDKSLSDILGELLVVSQFTVYGDCRKGRRPSFEQAETVERSRDIYEKFIEYFRKKYPDIKLEQGVFQAYMEVNISNDGPVTFIIESKKTF